MKNVSNEATKILVARVAHLMSYSTKRFLTNKISEVQYNRNINRLTRYHHYLCDHIVLNFERM